MLTDTTLTAGILSFEPGNRFLIQNPLDMVEVKHVLKTFTPFSKTNGFFNTNRPIFAHRAEGPRRKHPALNFQARNSHELCLDRITNENA